MHFNSERRRVFAFGLSILPLIAGSAYACTMPYHGPPITTSQISGVVLAVLFLPMIVLIPVELIILRVGAGLGRRMWVAYAACLLAKGAGLFVSLHFGPIAYSLIHFVVSYAILKQMNGKNILFVAITTSTLIPFLYTAGMALVGAIALIVIS